MKKLTTEENIRLKFLENEFNKLQKLLLKEVEHLQIYDMATGHGDVIRLFETIKKLSTEIYTLWNK